MCWWYWHWLELAIIWKDCSHKLAQMIIDLHLFSMDWRWARFSNPILGSWHLTRKYQESSIGFENLPYRLQSIENKCETFVMQHTGSRICYFGWENGVLHFLGWIVAWFDFSACWQRFLYRYDEMSQQSLARVPLTWMILVKHNIFVLTQGLIISWLLILVSAYLNGGSVAVWISRSFDQ